MKLRCTLDGLLLNAEMDRNSTSLVVFDGSEAFNLEALEAVYYELVSASCAEILQLERARYRLLRYADDFRTAAG